ncbi:Uncharacterised protein [Mycobacteroides abscessus subsp. abscessus]|nr:Uncharacterised protein [Mycobacteroides abscessus subsp. abscessus]
MGSASVKIDAGTAARLSRKAVKPVFTASASEVWKPEITDPEYTFSDVVCP